jgi:hypothetical protein
MIRRDGDVFHVDYSGGCSRMRVNLIKEASSHEQRKGQAKSKFKEKTTAHPERKKTGKESKG